MKTKIRLVLLFFATTLFLSGLTAIPVSAELDWVLAVLPVNSFFRPLLQTVATAYNGVAQKAPFLLYGYDWLAFAHFVLALLFIGPYRNPVRNKWVVEFALLACVLVIPFALIAGGLRGLPLWWRLGDCSFGLVGFAVLYPCYRWICRLETASSPSKYALS